MSATAVPFLESASITGILFCAAGAPTLTASASPFSPLTTAIFLTSLIASNFFANSKDVWYLSTPEILSKDIFKFFISFSIFVLNTEVPPIKYTFLAFNLCISAFVLSFNLSLLVKSIGAFFAFANGVADRASAIDESFTITTSSAFFHPSWLILTAVSYLSCPVKFVATVCALAMPAVELPAIIVTVSIAAIFFGIFILFSSPLSIWYYLIF